MNFRIPTDVTPSLRATFQQLATALTSEFNRRPPRGVPVDSLLLASPDGTVYTVTVANDGTLTTTVVG